MKLYYLPGACSLATCISLLEAGQKFEAFAVSRGEKRTADGKDYLTINPKGYVPALVLDNGEVLTENVAVLSYVATLNPAAKLAPPVGTLGYFRVVEWLAFISTEVHKNFGMLFKPGQDEAVKKMAKENLQMRLGFVEKALGDKTWLTGDDYTVADAYLGVVLSWSPRVGVDLIDKPKVTAYLARSKARPQVIAARKAEGLDD
ncbi:MAG: glutathione transferase GstA [Pseudomonadota bacterium]